MSAVVLARPGEVAPPSERRYDPLGAARALFSDRSDEVMLSGPAGTGKSRGCLEKMLCAALKYPKSRHLIVRKTRESLTEAALVTFEEKVAAERTPWLSNQQRRVRQSYALPNGSVIVVGGLDKADKVMSTEYDCVVGDTLVTSPSEIQRGYKRPYSGQLVTITTASGNQLTGTPNHPVFTDHGWFPLGQLREGDHVISRAGGNGEVVGRRRPDVADQPAEIAQVVGALALAESSRTERVETVRMDFHGDGGDGDVDVVTAGGLLKDGIDASLQQHVTERERDRRDLEQAALVADRSGRQRRVGRYPPRVPHARHLSELAHTLAVGRGVDPLLTTSGRRLSESSLPLGIGVSRVSQGLPFAGGANAKASIGQALFETPSTHMSRRSGLAEPDFPFHVEPDRIVKIGIREAGRGEHVYNLQTGNNWYVAQGIISHNCIYVQEARELSEGEWEALTTRLRNGVMPYQQIIGDTNPDAPGHWIKRRSTRGQLRLLESRHEDNPTVTASYLARLDALTGVRHKRLRLGLWAASEGIVYAGYDPSIHLVNRFPIPDTWTRYLAIDFGFTNPFVCQWWAEDEDGRLYRYRELYGTQRLVKDWAHAIYEAAPRQRYRAIVCDHDVEGRAHLEAHMTHSAEECGREYDSSGRPQRVMTTPAVKDVSVGIEAVAQRLQRAADREPRLFLLRDSLVERDPLLEEAKRPTCFEEEIEAYVWDHAASQKYGEVTLESPLKKDDHACDSARYLVMHVDRPEASDHDRLAEAFAARAEHPPARVTRLEDVFITATKSNGRRGVWD